MAKRKAYKVKPKAKSPQAANVKSIIKRRQHSQEKGSQGQHSRSKAKQRPQQRPARVPFDWHDRVLLVGEGDFSFALSLLENYRSASLTATCYDREDELVLKYPNVKHTIEKLIGGSSDFTRPAIPPTSNGNTQPGKDEEWIGFSPRPRRNSSTTDSDVGGGKAGMSSQCRVFYGIDATKLSTTHRKRLRSLAPFSKIVFNFPHVGGLSTDVNRQVRANQDLLVGFLNASKPFLSTPRNQMKRATADHHDDELSDDDVPTKASQILVTLFEGEPYTLWNLRDLARHCGLQVVESFKFPWQAYPGYQHARTIGDITSGKDRAGQGKRQGAWRGEERDARCYVLQCREDAESQILSRKSRKRGRLHGVGDDDND